MNYDFLLLTPLFVMVGILYWDLFKWGRELEQVDNEWRAGLQEWEFMNSVALYQESSDNIETLGNASNRSNQIPSHLHQQTD